MENGGSRSIWIYRVQNIRHPSDSGFNPLVVHNMKPTAKWQCSGRRVALATLERLTSDETWKKFPRVTWRLSLQLCGEAICEWRGAIDALLNCIPYQQWSSDADHIYAFIASLRRRQTAEKLHSTFVECSITRDKLEEGLQSDVVWRDFRLQPKFKGLLGTHSFLFSTGHHLLNMFGSR